MAEIIRALRASLSSLGQGRVWLYLLGPGIAAMVFMAGVSAFFLNRLSALFLEQTPMGWLGEWGMDGLSQALALLAAWLVILSASYLVAMLLASVFVLPLMLDYVAAKEYPALARRGKDSFWASAGNSLWALVLFLAGWTLTLPLWFIPGLGAILPFFWMGWLNRRTFARDALSAHADPGEARALLQSRSLPLLALGLLAAAAAHAPMVGLLAPSLAALVYVHFCLEALHRLREEAR
jgi:hypothetical protein